MSEGLGLWLRRTREVRKLTLEDAERALRIRQRYLQALETGDFAALPGEIQARGFLRNYARFLGLPIEEALARYEAERGGYLVQPRQQIAEGYTERILSRPSAFPGPPTEQEVTTSAVVLPGGLLQILIIALLFFGLVTLGGALYLAFMGDNSPSVAATPAATTTVTTPLPVVVAPVFVPAADGQVTVRLEPKEHAWVRVSADAAIVFEGFATPEEPIQYVAREQVIVATGNGGAFTLFVNGADWGPLGEQGQVVRRAWTPTGERPFDIP